MVTHTQKSCSAFNPSKVHTHSSEHTHTPWTHTRSSGQPFMLRRPGSSWGFGALLKGNSVMVLRVERALYIHSQFLPAWDSNSQPLGYESTSLTIRPRLPTWKCLVHIGRKRVCFYRWFVQPTHLCVAHSELHNVLEVFNSFHVVHVVWCGVVWCGGMGGGGS